MLKKTKVVMLPTNQKANICKDYSRNNQPLQYSKNGWSIYSEYEPFDYFHLYFISNEEIKEGEWVFYPNHKNLKIFQTSNHPFLNPTYVNGDIKRSIAFKIIASTDKSLEVVSKGINPVYEKLPEPSQSFIEKYITEYNVGRQIKEVMVEYEEYNWYPIDNEFAEILYRIKVAKDNTITIKRAKDTYTQAEVDDMLNRQTAETTAQMLKMFKGYKSREEVIKLLNKMGHDLKGHHPLSITEYKQWIEQNL